MSNVNNEGGQQDKDLHELDTHRHRLVYCYCPTCVNLRPWYPSKRIRIETAKRHMLDIAKPPSEDDIDVHAFIEEALEQPTLEDEMDMAMEEMPENCNRAYDDEEDEEAEENIVEHKHDEDIQGTVVKTGTKCSQY